MKTNTFFLDLNCLYTYIHRCTEQRQNTSRTYIAWTYTSSTETTLQTEVGVGGKKILPYSDKNIAKHNKVKFPTVSIAKPHYNISQFCPCLPHACINLPWPYWFQGQYSYGACITPLLRNKVIDLCDIWRLHHSLCYNSMKRFIKIRT